MLKGDNEMGNFFNDEGDVLVKESRFSYTIPIGGTTRLIVYNCSNVTGMEVIAQFGSKVIVEVSGSCMIMFTSDNVYAGVMSYDRKSGGYLPHLRIFAYIVQQEYVSIKYDISKMLETMKYKANCVTSRKYSKKESL